MKKHTVLNIIECRGSSYEIGRQYGEQARNNLQAAFALMLRSMEEMPYKAGKELSIRAAARYLSNVRMFDPGAEARVRGMADGAGMSFDEMFALQCYSELFINYPGLTGMCTSFAVTGEATKGGITFLGQNVDWHPDSSIDLVRIIQNDGTRLLGLFLNGYGSFYLNSWGVGNCANLTLCAPGPVTTHLPFAFYLYQAMQRKSLREAMETVSASARGVGYVHLADEGGSISGIESVSDGYVLMEPRQGMLVHANHYETEKYRGNDPARLYIPDSFHRANRMRELIQEQFGTITPEGLMKMLQDHQKAPKAVCTHVDSSLPWVFQSRTMASFIMIPAERRMFIAAGTPCEYEYVEYVV